MVGKSNRADRGFTELISLLPLSSSRLLLSPPLPSVLRHPLCKLDRREGVGSCGYCDGGRERRTF